MQIVVVGCSNARRTACDTGGATFSRLLTQGRHIFVVDFHERWALDFTGLSLARFETIDSDTAPGDRFDHTIETVERLLAQLFRVDAYPDGQVLAAMRCITTFYHGPIWQGALDHAVKNVIHIGCLVAQGIELMGRTPQAIIVIAVLAVRLG
ncbi:hypothetical protein D3C85_999160 [compost metagenome]